MSQCGLHLLGLGALLGGNGRVAQSALLGQGLGPALTLLLEALRGRKRGQGPGVARVSSSQDTPSTASHVCHIHHGYLPLGRGPGVGKAELPGFPSACANPREAAGRAGKRLAEWTYRLWQPPVCITCGIQPTSDPPPPANSLLPNTHLHQQLVVLGGLRLAALQGALLGRDSSPLALQVSRKSWEGRGA